MIPFILNPTSGKIVFFCTAAQLRVGTLNEHSTGIPRFTLLMWDTNTNPGSQNLQKSRLLSSTKGEENRIEILTAVNQKLRKSKLQKLRNACISKKIFLGFKGALHIFMYLSQILQFLLQGFQHVYNFQFLFFEFEPIFFVGKALCQFSEWKKNPLIKLILMIKSN